MSNLRAFLDMIAHAEIGPTLLANSDHGYNVLVGGKLFSSYADHPRQLIQVRPGLKSTAAGRYQILARYFDHYKALLGLRDFSPASQDEIAIQMIREQRAFVDVQLGRFDSAVDKVKNIWASMPGAGYSQPEHSLASLRDAFVKAGGQLA